MYVQNPEIQPIFVSQQHQPGEGDFSRQGLQEELRRGKHYWHVTNVENWEGVGEEGWLLYDFWN